MIFKVDFDRSWRHQRVNETFNDSEFIVNISGTMPLPVDRALIPKINGET